MAEGRITAVPYAFDSSTAEKKGAFHAFTIPLPAQDLKSQSETSSTMFRPQENKKKRMVVWGLRYAFIVIFVGLILAIPLLLFRRDQAPDDDSLKDKNTKNLIFYLFAWFETTWLFSCVVDMFVMAIPYVFRFAAG